MLRDLLVVGFDNLQAGPWEERFPTTKSDFVRMGERVAEVLLERIGSRNFQSSEVVLPCPAAHIEQFNPSHRWSVALEPVP